ncbi:hypothetical protein JOJ86_005876 [Rhodococcus percolatus]|uniref:hypothetical protein n=1 Tax=Rhodococcus opacus TaxID=37919 RepID=UPI001AEA162D|nr:hypothetical protein [Rhodococcus opacus]MBP2208150.1 hypothetical protein [Rhodococcus opacus]
MTVYSQPVTDIAGAGDQTRFWFYREDNLSPSTDESAIITNGWVDVQPVDGVLTTPSLVPGPAKVSWGGKEYDLVIPDHPDNDPIPLWPDIQNYVPQPSPVVSRAVEAARQAGESADAAALSAIAAEDAAQSSGKSAYEIAVQNGFVGNEAAWLASLVSDVPGASAYEIAVADGFVGTEAQWLTSLESTVPGPQGDGLQIDGQVATYAGLPAAPAEGSAFFVEADGMIYVYQSGWPAEGSGMPLGGLLDGSVDSSKIAPGAVTNTHIEDGSLEQAKLQPTGPFSDELGTKVTTPTGGIDGQALIKAGSTIVWGAAGLSQDQVDERVTAVGDAEYAPVDLYTHTFIPTGTPDDFANLQTLIGDWNASGKPGVLRIGVGSVALTGPGGIGALRIPANAQPLLIEGAGKQATKFVLSRSVPRLFDLYGTGAGNVFANITVRGFSVDAGGVTPVMLGSTTVAADVTLQPGQYTTVTVADNSSFSGAGTQWASARVGGVGTLAGTRLLFTLPGGGVTTTMQLWNTSTSAKTLKAGDYIDGYLYDHVLFGNNNVGSTAGTASIFRDITVEDVDVVNVPTQYSNGLGAFTPSLRFGFYLGVGSGGKAERINVRRVRITGGECGFSVSGSATSWIDEVLFEDCYHDTSLLPTMNSGSYNYLVGQDCPVGNVLFSRCVGVNSADVGIELDQPVSASVSDCEMRNTYSASYYVTNFSPPARSASGPTKTTLTAALDNVATTASVATLPANFPASGVVRIGSEVALYQRASATSLTLIRGIDTSTAAAAASGVDVVLVDHEMQNVRYARCSAVNELTPGKGWWLNPNSGLPLPGIRIRDSRSRNVVSDVASGNSIVAFGFVPFVDIDTFKADVKLNNTSAQAGASYAGIRLWRSGLAPITPAAHPCVVRMRNTKVYIEGEVVSGPTLRPVWVGDGFYDLDLEVDISNRARGFANGATHGISIQPSGASMQLLKAVIDLKYSCLSSADVVPHMLYGLGNIAVTDRIYLSVDMSDAYVTTNQIPWNVPAAVQPLIVVGRVLPPKLSQLHNAIQPAHITTVTASPYAAAHVDDVILVNRSAATTVNLPPTASGNALAIPRPGAGTMLTIKDAAGNAATNNIVVNAAAGETIDGATPKTINTNYGVLKLVSNGTGWSVI